MKKSLSVFDLMFIVFLYCKGTQTAFFGSHISWVELFSPYFIELLLTAFAWLLRAANVVERIRFFLWKISMRRVFKKGKKTPSATYTNFKINSNPGQYQDPEKTGK